METEKKKRGRPPKHKTVETTGMTYDGAINYTLDKQVRAELDDTLAHKSEDELTEDERKYLKHKREKKAYTLNIRFTESEMQDILFKCKDCAVDGKAPKRSELEKMLADLKTEYKALLPEHNAFLKRKAAAAPYTKTVRTYLENQRQQERDRQYKERKLTQHRKNDALE